MILREEIYNKKGGKNVNYFLNFSVYIFFISSLAIAKGDLAIRAKN